MKFKGPECPRELFFIYWRKDLFYLNSILKKLLPAYNLCWLIIISLNFYGNRYLRFVECLCRRSPAYIDGSCERQPTLIFPRFLGPRRRRKRVKKYGKVVNLRENGIFHFFFKYKEQETIKLFPLFLAFLCVFFPSLRPRKRVKNEPAGPLDHGFEKWNVLLKTIQQVLSLTSLISVTLYFIYL